MITSMRPMLLKRAYIYMCIVAKIWSVCAFNFFVQVSDDDQNVAAELGDTNSSG